MCTVNPKIDIIFKKLFSSEENKDLLLSLINSIMPETRQLKDITIKNPYNLQSYLTDKLSILDVKGEDEKGVLYNIEIQIEPQDFWGQRALYYWSKVYSNQLEVGKMYSKLNKTIVISLLDFSYFLEDKRFHRVIVPKDLETNKEYEDLDYLELHFIEMNKHQTPFNEIKTQLDRWISFLNHAYELDARKLPEKMRDNLIEKALDQVAVMHLSKDEREVYEDRMKWTLDKEAQIETALRKGLSEGREKGLSEGREKGLSEGREKGLSEGREKGLSEGREKGLSEGEGIGIKKGRVEGEHLAKIEIAKSMIKKNLDPETISELTGLSIEEIKNIY